MADLQLIKQTYNLHDIKKEVEQLMKIDNTFIVKYYSPGIIDNKTGKPKEFNRALISKSVNGKELFFDYRMNPDPKNEKAWVTFDEWQHKTGLSGYQFERMSLSDMKITKIEPKQGNAQKQLKNIVPKKFTVAKTVVTEQKPAGQHNTGKPPHQLLISYYNEQKDIYSGGEKHTRHKIRGKHAIGITKGFEGIFERMSEPLTDRNGENTTAIKLVEKYSKIYNVPFDVSLALFSVESGFIKEAVSSSGCKGLGQLANRTALSLASKEANSNKGNLIFSGKTNLKTEIFDLEKNIEASIVYLSQMIKRFDGDIARSFEAYNKGPAGGRNLDYRQRALSFLKFYGEIKIENLKNMGVQEFTQTQDFKNGYERLGSLRNKSDYFASR